MLAIALVLEGRSRAEAAESCGMDRQTLCDWVHRYNAEGLAGLADRRGAVGVKPRLTPEQEAQVDAWVESGPDPALHGGLVRWRRVDLRDLIAHEFGVGLHERSVGKLLRRLDFRRLSVRPQHPESDPAAQEAFKKTEIVRNFVWDGVGQVMANRSWKRMANCALAALHSLCGIFQSLDAR
ncbi:winged helix-turn-helix domain-containing protein, partial [Siccirubricoccus deserti]|nr:winged helix-turn-helix domain-containing protein [Siccirubricoccus deserti]